jgi:hypothetical protein
MKWIASFLVISGPTFGKIIFAQKHSKPGLPDGLFSNQKTNNLGKFWRALDWKMFIYFLAICNMLRMFGIIYDHLVHFVFIWYIFPFLVPCTKKNLATSKLCLFNFTHPQSNKNVCFPNYQVITLPTTKERRGFKSSFDNYIFSATYLGKPYLLHIAVM